MAELDPDTLATILETEGYGLIPLSSEQRMQAALDVRSALKTASTEAEGARALRKRLECVAQLLSDETAGHLARLQIFWVESGLPHAAAILHDGTPAILVCRGLFDLVHFQTTLNSACSLLRQTEAKLGMGGAPESLPSGRMNLAGYVILADAYRHLRPPATIADLLGPKALLDVDLGVSTSLVLLLLHELGHVVLGHTDARSASARATVDTVPDPGESRERLRLQLEADAYALDGVAPQWRAQMLASLICLHNVFHFFEIFGVRPAREYPTADQRLAALIERMPLSGPDRIFADSWLGDYRRREATIAARPSTADEMVNQFDRTMDVATAYRVVDEIRADLNASGIVLEKPDITLEPQAGA